MDEWADAWRNYYADLEVVFLSFNGHQIKAPSGAFLLSTVFVDKAGDGTREGLRRKAFRVVRVF